jgi:hypothetical protein
MPPEPSSTSCGARGYPADELDVRHDPFGGPYDAVVAFAVFLHLTRDEFVRALGKSRRAVRPCGVLAITVKDGDGSGWSVAKLNRPRYFTYWRAEPLRAVLERGGWHVSQLRAVSGRSENWLYVVATRA